MLIVLGVAALLAGMTGSWSPCGLSMVATLGPAGHRGGRWATLAACAAFVPGALAGGLLTFGSLALAGAALGGGTIALGLAAGALLVAALLDARGARVVPQIRRQVPEHWRRVLPLPLAAGLYGVLLGMGFTTFVLSFAVPALAAVALALGDPVVGLVLGLGFGAGRALPIVVLAPLASTRAGARASELMAERPAILRGLRIADALALGVLAAVLGAEGVDAAFAVAVVARGATDPTLAGSLLAWQAPGAGAHLLSGGRELPVQGSHPALGGPHLATRVGAAVRVLRWADGGELATLPGPAGSGPLAVSARWLVVRSSSAAGDVLEAISLADGSRRTVAQAAAPSQLGRPALDGDRLVFHRAGRGGSELREIDLRSGAARTLRRAHGGVVLNPALDAGRLLYVHATSERQRLLLGGRERAGAADRRLYEIPPTARRDAGHEPGRGRHRAGYPGRRPPPLWERPARGVTRSLWTTALGARGAYVARLSHAGDGTADPLLLRVGL